MTGRPIRVLLLAGLPPPVGGIAAFTDNLLAYAAGSSDVTLDLVDCTVRWRRPTQLNLAYRLVGGSLQALGILWQVRRRIREARPDVAHLCSAGGLALLRDLAVMRLLRRAGIPVVFWSANDLLPPQLSSRGPIGWLARRIVTRIRTLVVLDRRTEAFMRRYPGMRIERIPVFVRTDEIRAEVQTPAAGADIVYAGWHIDAKGVPELVDACAGLPGIRLRTLGPVEASYARELRARAGAHPPDISGLVPRRALLEAIAGATALALPSHGEGTPIVVLEAMALGVPVIATPVGALPEILELDSAQACGVSVPVGDVPALRRAIAAICGDREAAKAMGRRGMARAETQYSARAVFPRLLALWRSVAGAEER